LISREKELKNSTFFKEIKQVVSDLEKRVPTKEKDNTKFYAFQHADEDVKIFEFIAEYLSKKEFADWVDARLTNKKSFIEKLVAFIANVIFGKKILESAIFDYIENRFEFIPMSKNEYREVLMNEVSSFVNTEVPVIKDEYKGKLIFVMSGLGKSYITDNKNIFDTDELLSTILNVPVSKVASTLRDYSSEQRKSVYKTLQEKVDSLTKKGKTVLTANVNLLKNSNYVFGSDNLTRLKKSVESTDRDNPYTDSTYLKSVLDRLKLEPTVVYLSDDNYISDILLKNPKEYKRKQTDDYKAYNEGKRKISKVNEELDAKLLAYVKQFGVTVVEMESFKERFGVDAIGATDVIQKLIFINSSKKNYDTVSEEVSHMIVMLMGESPEIKILLSNIESWSEYKSIYDKYFPIYKNEKKVKVEAIGQLVSKAIQMEYSSSNPIEKTLFEKIKEWLLKFIGKYKDLSKYEYFPLAQQIASNILSGDESFIRKNESRKISDLDYDKSLNNTPLAKYVFDMVAENFPMAKLTGSLALSKQVNVERFSNMPIHDLDYVISSSYSSPELLNKILDLDNKPNIIKIHDGITNSDFTTYSYLIAPEGYTLNNKKNTSRLSFENLEGFDKTGRKLSTLELSENTIPVDFFYNNKDKYNDTLESLSAWQNIFTGKLGLSKTENEVLFQRQKDLSDYIKLNPTSYQNPIPENLYFSVEDSIKSDLKKIISKFGKKFGKNQTIIDPNADYGSLIKSIASINSEYPVKVVELYKAPDGTDRVRLIKDNLEKAAFKVKEEEISSTKKENEIEIQKENTSRMVDSIPELSYLSDDEKFEAERLLQSGQFNVYCGL